MNKTLLESWAEKWPEVRSSTPAATGEGVIDQGAFNTIEVDEVFNTVNYCQTTVGQAVLYRSLTHPLDDAEQIREKQQSVQEIQQHPELQQALELMIGDAKADEFGLYQLLYGNFLGMFGTSRENEQVEGYGYEPYIKGCRLFTTFQSHIENLPNIETPYLLGLKTKFQEFTETRAFSLMQGPVYKTEHAIYCKKDKPKLAPAFVFKPRIFKPLFLVAVFALIWVISLINPLQSGTPEFTFSPVFALFTIPLALLYIPFVGSFDRDYCILPLREEFRNSKDVQQVLDVLGQFDELLSFIKYAQDFDGETVMPEIIDAKHHQIALKNVKNPVLAKHYAEYVGNDFELMQEKLVFITGPNSGGKTAFCKTVTQVQLLSQIGCFVPASAAKLTVADRIFYQVPEISHMDDGEGRFGTELKRTKAIFVAATPKSLVVLDELSEGTTFEEKMETSANVLNGFYQKGNNTLLITHNHQLVDEFQKTKTGIAKQVQFTEDAPTYKLVPGISRVSHADRVAKKIGFSKQDIENLLTK